MRFGKLSLALGAAMMAAPLSASALGISITNVSSTVVSAGDTVTIDLVVENTGNEEVFGLGLGLGITGYDIGNDGSSTNNNLVFAGGSSAASVFNEILIGGAAFGGLNNISAEPSEQGTGPPFLDPLRISLFNAASLAPSNGDGTLDVGINGQQTNGADVHFQVQFVAQGGSD